MADAIATAGTGAPAAGDTTVTTPAAPAAPAAAAPAAQPQADDPTWFKPRLEAAKTAAERKILADLGVTDVAAAKAILAEAKAKADAGKTAEQKTAELEAQLRSVISVSERNAAIVNEQAARLYGSLSEKERAIVDIAANNDPALRLDAIQKLVDAGVIDGGDEPAPPKAAPIPAAASTGNAGAPPAPGAHAQPNHLATYTDLQRRNPVHAAHYLITNFDAIQKAKQATT
jgi:hypothetical protein